MRHLLMLVVLVVLSSPFVANAEYEYCKPWDEAERGYNDAKMNRYSPPNDNCRGNYQSGVMKYNSERAQQPRKRYYSYGSLPAMPSLNDEIAERKRALREQQQLDTLRTIEFNQRMEMWERRK